MATRKSSAEIGTPSRAEQPPEKQPESIEILTVDEAIARFPGEWILMEVTEFNARRMPFRGRVAIHNRSRRRFDAAMDRIDAFTGEPGPYYYLFSGYPRAYTGEEARAALARAAEEGREGAWRRW